MTRLSDLINPTKIYMGEKDFQQIYLVKKFLKRKYELNIISCKTVRDKNNLALSSRNLLLNRNQLTKASKISKSIIEFKKELNKKKDIKKLIFLKKN